MPQPAQARAWWADVEDVRERIEHRRARERQARAAVALRGQSAVRAPAAERGSAALAQRGVREVRPGRHLMAVRSGVPPAGGPASTATGAWGGSLAHRRRTGVVWGVTRQVGSRPDMLAAWAVALGFALVIAAVLSAHA